MDDFKVGDLVYCKNKNKNEFGRIEGREYHRKLKNGSALKIKLEGTDKIWYVTESSLIKVEPDTPQNRLAIQIKYG
jgi:hypothetical protein